MKWLRDWPPYQNHLRGRRLTHWFGRIYYECTQFGALGLMMRWILRPWQEFRTPRTYSHLAVVKMGSFAVPPLVFHSHLDCNRLGQPELMMDISPTWVGQYRNATVVGGSEMVLLDRGPVVIDSNYKPEEDLAPLETHRRLRYSDDFSRLKSRVSASRDLESGISLLSPHSPNYMHFVTEVLPKAVLADDLPVSLPWIVDADVSKGHLEFLAVAVRNPRRLVFTSLMPIVGCNSTLELARWAPNHRERISTQSCLDVYVPTRGE
jgi:hypothetical protein